jgi:hypothetical protein
MKGGFSHGTTTTSVTNESGAARAARCVKHRSHFTGRLAPCRFPAHGKIDLSDFIQIRARYLATN